MHVFEETVFLRYFINRKVGRYNGYKGYYYRRALKAEP